MRRRTLLRTVPLAALSGVAGCSGLGHPDVEMKQGTARLHPATDRYLANGLQPDGDDRLLVAATPDEAPDRVGPNANDAIADDLRNPGTDQFHVVVQLRSTPDAPMELWPTVGDPFEWTGQSTLRVTVDVEPWGSLGRIDDAAQRERLTTADELVWTTVWTLTPNVDDLPDDVELVLDARN
jgi:hypothetical protein